MAFEPAANIIQAYWVFLAAALVIGVATGWLVAAQSPNTGSGQQDTDRRQ